MTAYLLDTNHAGDLLQPHPTLPPKMAAAPNATFLLCTPSVGELWHMVFNSARVAANQAKLQHILSRFTIRDFDSAAARDFGHHLTHLRRIGRPIPSIDLQIASIATAHDLTVLTADAHFNHIPGLKHENWL